MQRHALRKLNGLQGGWLLLGLLLTPSLKAREVMSWVPPYAIEDCRTILENRFGDYSPSNGLTRIGLQFWIPTPSGGVVRTTEYGDISEADITWFQNWGAAHGIEVLLCVYNNVGAVWDWNLAVSAFGNHPSAFVSNLVAAMQHHALDGIDIDLEGLVAPSPNDRLAFKRFLEQLSAELKSRGKLLTVNSFHSPLYNAPNLSWWSDWTGLVNNVHSMGYDDLYEGSTVTLPGVNGYLFRYSWQQAYGVREAGLAPEMISMGLPGWLASWGSGGQGANVLNHIRECISDCAVPASICIWDLQLSGTSGATNWRSAQVWEALASLARYESVPADQDRDGMADAWETKRFGGASQTNGGPLDDPDGDLCLNREEYVAGTDPTNKSSLLLLSIQRHGQGAVVVGHPAHRVAVLDGCYGDLKRYYRFEHCSDLSADVWQPVPGASNVIAIDGPIYYTNAVSGTGDFYRVRVGLRQATLR